MKVPLPADGMFSPAWKADARAPPKLGDVISEDAGVSVDVCKRDGGIEFAKLGTDDNAGNFIVKLVFVAAAAGNAAGEFAPNSSASTHETTPTLNIPHNNRID